MLARVPVINAYDPSTESMLAHSSSSYKIAIMITGLVIDCLGTNIYLCYNKLSTKTNLVVSLSKQLLAFIFVFFTFLQAYPKTPTKYF